jgi:hypothetical protein
MSLEIALEIVEAMEHAFPVMSMLSSHPARVDHTVSCYLKMVNSKTHVGTIRVDEKVVACRSPQFSYKRHVVQASQNWGSTFIGQEPR